METNHSDIYPEAVMAHKEAAGGMDALYDYVNKLWLFLEGLKPGIRIPVDNIVREDTKELFKAVVMMYQEETMDYSVQFNIDSTILRKKRI